MFEKNESILLLLTFLLLVGCDDDTEESPKTLKEQFHGKYEVVSAMSDNAVDLNMDGVNSRDLLLENTEILNAEIALRIYEDANVFIEYWPIEYISVLPGEKLDSSRYEPSYSVYYAKYAITSYFECSPTEPTIELRSPEPVLDSNTGLVDTRFVFPDAIQIQEDNSLVILSTRNLYTSEGYKKENVIAHYRKYTSQ